MLPPDLAATVNVERFRREIQLAAKLQHPHIGKDYSDVFDRPLDTSFPRRSILLVPGRPQYAVAPDNRRFLMIGPVATNAPDKLIMVENWFEELKAKPRK